MNIGFMYRYSAESEEFVLKKTTVYDPLLYKYTKEDTSNEICANMITKLRMSHSSR